MDDGPSSSPLGYKPLVGAQMRYAVHDRDGRPVAMLGFSTAAWKLAPRDRFIGWTPQLREKNLPLVVDNPRFLILPWIKIPNLGSHILAIVRRRLPEDWTGRYEASRGTRGAPPCSSRPSSRHREAHTGAVYRASGWIHVGTTQGRGRYDRRGQTASSVGRRNKEPKPEGHLASHILAIPLPEEKHNPRAHRTFVQTPRYTGAVYRASGLKRRGPGTRNAPNRKRTSGFAPSEKIGNEPSTAKVRPPITARPNDYQQG